MTAQVILQDMKTNYFHFKHAVHLAGTSIKTEANATLSLKWWLTITLSIKTLFKITTGNVIVAGDQISSGTPTKLSE